MYTYVRRFVGLYGCRARGVDALLLGNMAVYVARLWALASGLVLRGRAWVRFYSVEILSGPIQSADGSNRCSAIRVPDGRAL
jgi:hypothetical protein